VIAVETRDGVIDIDNQVFACRLCIFEPRDEVAERNEAALALAEVVREFIASTNLEPEGNASRLPRGLEPESSVSEEVVEVLVNPLGALALISQLRLELVDLRLEVGYLLGQPPCFVTGPLGGYN
jgi:hypothetical protein